MDTVAACRFEAVTMIKKVSKHIVQNEPLLFEQSSPGKRGYQLPDWMFRRSIAEAALGAEQRARGNRRLSGNQRI